MARVQVFDEQGALIDLRGVAPWDGEGFSVAPGEYVFEVEEATQEQSSKDKPQLALGLRIVSGLATEVHNDQKMKHWISLTGKAAPRLRNFLNAVGIEADADGGFDDQDLIGRQFQAEVFESEYQKGTDPVTGAPNMKTSSKIRKERLVEGEAGASQAPAAPPAPLPRAAAPQRPAPPPARAQRPLPTARVASPLLRPGQRAPLPGASRR